MKCTVLAPAKLNLFLDITGRRNDGYHLVNMVMQAISLEDEVTVSVDEDADGILVECSDEEIPCDATNTAYRAAEVFFARTALAPVGVTIKIKKRIPSQAGMAGGSTDAAAVLTALNELLHTELSLSELAEMAEEIGADVPFCLYGGTMTAGGIGTILNPLPDLPDCRFVIVKPEIKVSTAEAYRKSDTVGYAHLANGDKVVSGICNGDLSEIGRGLYNKFEKVVDIPEIDDIKAMMLDCGAEGACLTGSGSAVFGLFAEKADADASADRLSEQFELVFTAQPLSRGTAVK